MADPESDKPSKPGSSNRPNTIDLTATEIPISESAEPRTPREEPLETAPQEAAPDAQPVAADDPQVAAVAEPEAVPSPEQARADDIATEEKPEPRPREASRGVPWGLIAAGIIGGGLLLAVGIGAGHWLSREMASSAPAPAAPVAPVSQAAIPPELLERLAKLEAALTAQRAPDPQLVARVAAAEAAVKTATETAAARERRNEETAAIAREARERASSAASTADEAAQKVRTATVEHSRAEAEAVLARLAAIEEVTRANQAEIAKHATAKVNDERSRAAIAALSLRNAVESGAPFTSELEAMRAMTGDAKSIDTLAPFAQSGVPTAASLGRELQAVMPSLWKAARANEPSEGTFLEKLQANAQKIVHIRPAGEVAGEDVGSVKARLELRAANADIRGALTELSKLPADARAPAQGWIKKAEARNAAIAAAQSLAQSALAALAKSGS